MQGDQFQTSFLFFKKTLFGIKENGLQLTINIFQQSTTWGTIKTKCLKLHTIDSEI